MNALNRKLVRDLRHLWSQMAAIALLVAVGVATVVTTRTSYRSLEVSLASYYAGYRFADVFAQVTRAPESVLPRIAAIGGVRAVESRVTADVALDVPGLDEPATGRVVSVPASTRPRINDLHLRSGRYLEASRPEDIMVSEAFASANQLVPGDSLGAVLHGHWQRLRIVGIALSPEYIYEIRSTDIFPDNRRFGVIWMSRSAASAAFDMEGAFNDLGLAVEPGANVADIITAVDRTLTPYGGLGAFGRNDQVSHRFISDELKQNRTTGMVVPAIFLGIAAFLLNVVLSRLVATERDQIAVLKAFGYGNPAVSVHYLKLALVAVSAGALAGILLGQWLAAGQIVLYSRFYRFPDIHRVFDGTAAALAIVVTAAAGLLGALGAVRAAVRLPPAEAMRPEAPSQFKAGWLERLGLARFTRPASRIIVRSLARKPVKAILSMIGIGWAVAILIVGRQLVDSILYIARFQFGVVQREDVTVTFSAPRSGRIRHELSRLPGVMRSEPFRAVPARLRSDYRSRLVAVLGLARGNELRRLVDRQGIDVELPQYGIVLASKLAEVLGVRVGDVITAEVLEGARPTRPVVVTGTVDELIGMSAYMELGAVNRLLHEGETLSGAFLTVDPNRASDLYRRLKRTSIGAGIGRREAAWASFTTTLAQSMGIVTTVLVTLACLLAFALVYNVGRIALSERGRELASLRVLGFTRGEVASMLLGEQALLTVAALPLGLALGYLASALITRAYQWELYRLPLVVNPATYAVAMAIIVGAAIASGALVRRRVDRLDLVAVLKTRE